MSSLRVANGVKDVLPLSEAMLFAVPLLSAATSTTSMFVPKSRADVQSSKGQDTCHIACGAVDYFSVALSERSLLKLFNSRSYRCTSNDLMSSISRHQHQSWKVLIICYLQSSLPPEVYD